MAYIIPPDYINYIASIINMLFYLGLKYKSCPKWQKMVQNESQAMLLNGNVKMLSFAGFVLEPVNLNVQYNQKMETAEEMRVKMAEMRLAALQTEFSNANWTYNLQIKALKERLAQKNRTQNELQTQLAQLRHAYAEHQHQLQGVLAKAAELDHQETSVTKAPSISPKTRETVSRRSPKNISKGLFFKVQKQEKKKMYLSPDITQTPATNTWQKMHSARSNPAQNPEKSQTIIMLKENYSLRSMGSEKTLGNSTTGESRRDNRDLTTRLQDKNGAARGEKKRQEKCGPCGF